MDFTFTPEADEAAELTASILRDKTGTDRLKEVEAAGDRFDRELWATLGEAFDWSDLGLIERCTVRRSSCSPNSEPICRPGSSRQPYPRSAPRCPPRP